MESVMFRDIATQSGAYLWTKSFLLQKGTLGLIQDSDL
jgi:hypothetical protein